MCHLMSLLICLVFSPPISDNQQQQVLYHQDQHHPGQQVPWLKEHPHHWKHKVFHCHDRRHQRQEVPQKHHLLHHR